jgi:transcriptional regulator with XRE-family HTH domain
MSMQDTVERRRELADFLRSRRERVSPEGLGIPNLGRRRTPGLRREEVALLAGISSTWYTYLEQGRDVRVSGSVVESVSRVLGLSRSERDHLYLLAKVAPPQDASPGPDSLDPRLAHLLASLGANPAYITDAHSDLLGWNAAAGALFDGFDRLPAERRNLLWWVFAEPAAREVMLDWEAEARALLGRHRAAAARHREPGFTALVEELCRLDPLAARWWSSHDVQSSSSGSKRLRHPQAGELTLDHSVLQTAENPEIKVVVYCAAPGSEQAAALTRVARGKLPRTPEHGGY